MAKTRELLAGERGGHNITELADVPDEKMKLAEEHWHKPVRDQRVNHSKWVVTEEFGGGEIYFDGELVRKNGRFVPEYLQGLNPESLM